MFFFPSKNIFNYVSVYDGSTVKLFADAQLVGLPVFMINPSALYNYMPIFIVLYVLLELISLGIVFRLIRYLKSHSKSFTERTYRLQMQLIYSLCSQVRDGNLVDI